MASEVHLAGGGEVPRRRHDRWGTRLGAAELVRAGVTTLCDMYFYTHEIADAVRDDGLRAIVGQACLDFATPQKLDVDANIAYAEQLIERWRGDALITPALAPHAPYTVSPSLLRRLHALAQRHDVPLLIHLAETSGEVEEVQGRYGARPVQHLEQLGVLDARLIAAHCMWVDPDDIALLSRRRVAWCTIRAAT